MKPVYDRHRNFVRKYVTSTQALSPRPLNGHMSHMAFVSTRLPLFLILSLRGQQLSFTLNPYEKTPRAKQTYSQSCRYTGDSTLINSSLSHGSQRGVDG